MPFSLFLRRSRLTLLAILLFLASVPATADALPDPRRLRTQGIATDPALISPGRLGLPAAETSRPRRPADDARRMAAQVVRSLDTLTLQAAALLDDLAALENPPVETATALPDTERNARRLRRAELQQQRDEALEQIGYGLNLWRTSITFERRLLGQAETDRLTAADLERDRAEEQLARLRAQRESVLQQEQARETALTERLASLQSRAAALEAEQVANESAQRDNRLRLDQQRLLLQAARGDAGESGLLRELARLTTLAENLAAARNALIDERQTLDRERAETSTALENARSRAALVALDREMAMWAATLDQIDTRHAENRRRFQAALARATETAVQEQQRLADFLKRGRLAGTARLAVLGEPHNPGTGFLDLGGLYRMGDFSTARRREELPDVNAFVVAFMAGAPNNAGQHVQDKRS